MLVPELLLIGQLIDRSGMALVHQRFRSRQEMPQIAIEEWMASSPIYTKRMQKALKYEGVDVITIFKGLQLDIGAPAAVHGLPLHRARPVARRVPPRPLRRADGRRADGRGLRPRHVPRHRGPDLRRHRASPPTARPRSGPIHRPPRTPADRHPHCAWTVIIDESYPEVADHPGDGRRCAEPRAARPSSTRSIPTTKGRPTTRARCCPTSTSARSRTRRWSGSPTRSACRCTCWTCRSCIAVRQARRATRRSSAAKICTKQLIGIAGVAAERIHRALELPGGIEGALRVLELHPLLNPAAYVSAEFGPDFGARAPLARARGRRLDLAGRRRSRSRPLQADRRRRRPAPRRRGHRHRHRLDRAGDRDRHGGKGIARGRGRASSAAAPSWVFEPRKSLPLTVV